MNFIKKILFFTTVILLMAIAGCEEQPDYLYKKIQFTQLASFPPGGRASAVSFSINGKGFVALGRTKTNSNAMKDVWAYNPETDNWTQKKNFPGTARTRAASAVVDGKAYVGMGYNPAVGLFEPAAYLNDWWMYNPETDTWTARSPFPGAGRISCFSFVYDGLIYIGSGYDGLYFTNEFFTYNSTNNTWKKLKNIPAEARSGPVACTNGERIFFGTGFDVFDVNDWWEYLPATDEWEKKRKMPDKGRENALALNVSGRFFVATGRNFGGEYTGGQLKSDILEYNPDENKWYKRGNLPADGRDNAISFVINNKGYIGLGENDLKLMDDFWSFVP